MAMGCDDAQMGLLCYIIWVAPTSAAQRILHTGLHNKHCWARNDPWQARIGLCKPAMTHTMIAHFIYDLLAR